jgi:hydroxypyruvate isomerase
MARFAANLGFLWHELPLLQRIEAAAKAGFRAVEMHWPYEVAAHDVRRACDANALSILGINTAPGRIADGDFGLGAVRGREGEFQSAIDQAIAYCLASGATAVHAMAGNVPAQLRCAARNVFIHNLQLAADKTAAHGLTLLLEPLNPRDHPHYFYSTIGVAADLIAELGRSNIKLQFDVYHVGVSEGDILTKLQRHLPIIGHVQIAAVPSRAEPDEGEVAYDAIFEGLERMGYAGWIGCEYRPRAATQDGLCWAQHLGVTLSPDRDHEERHPSGQHVHKARAHS